MSASMGKRAAQVCAILVVILAASWGLKWILVPAELTSPDNVKKQWAAIYQQLEALDTTARQICSAEKALASAGETNEASQRRTQLMTYEQNYARIQGEYNAKLRNQFEAKLVKPADVPDKAPELAEVKARLCH